MHSILSQGARRAISGLCLTSMALALSACGGGSDSAAPAALPPAPAPVAPLANQLYTQTNETANMIVHMVRNLDGSITIKDRTATGGAGLNGIKPGASSAAPDSLVSNNSVIINTEKTLLFAVNGGDNSISVFAIDQTSGALTLKKTTSTLGTTPSSLAYRNGKLYVVFQTGPNQLGAYNVNADGSLSQIDLTRLPAPGMTPTEVVVSPDGNYAVVGNGTASNTVASFPLNGDGSFGTAVVNTSGFSNPFAGGFATKSVYLETNTGGQALASYTFDSTGTLTLIGSVGNAQGAPCWLATTPSGQFAFVGNGAGTISAYSVSASGTLTLLNATAAKEAGVLTGVNSVAGDSWISADGKFLYSAYLGDDKVVAYSIGADGSLTKLNEQVIGTATKVSLHGMAGI